MGLKFFRVDLHVHTPASQDFPNIDNEISPKDIVNRALQKGLRAIAITDHNTNDWVDKVKKAAKGTNLTVFPGIELNVVGGEKGIHLLAIFDPSEGAEKIHQLWIALTAKKGLGLKEFHKQDFVLKCAPHEAYLTIEDLGGICIPAHITSSKGMIHDMKGLPRKQFFSLDKPLVVEARDWDENGNLIRSKPAVNYLNGKDPNYNNSNPAIIQGSDCLPISMKDNQDQTLQHSIDHIGERFTYLKMGEKIDLESLKQCFIDHEVRIRHMFQQIDYEFPKIISIDVEGGFLNKSKITFNSGLNAIIGGKGTGKSLLIEFLRANLKNVSTINKIKEDNIKKLKKKLGAGGRISIVFQTQHEGIYRNVLSFNKDDDLNYECKRLELENNKFKDTGELFEGDIHSLFPISAFSQTEIVRIVETPEFLRDMLDGFIDQGKIEEEIQSLKYKIMESDNSLQGLKDTRDNIRRIQRNILTLRAQKSDITRKLSSDYQNQLRILEQDNNCFKKWKGDYNKLLLRITTFYEPFTQLMKAEDLSVVKSQILVDLREIIEAIRDESKEKLSTFSQLMTKFNRKVDEIDRQWNVEYKTQKDKILSYFGKDISKLEKELSNIEEEIIKPKNDLENELSREKELKSQLENRKNVVNKLYEKKRERTKNRKIIAKTLSEGTKGIVKVEITTDTDLKDLERSLEELRVGSRLGTDLVPLIASKTDGKEFAFLFIAKNIKKLAKITTVNEGTIQKWLNYVQEHRNWEKVLRLEHQGLKNDVPKFYYKENHSYKELKECSVGQKAAIILILILSQSKYPLIIDQPEDALDLATIYKDIVYPIREKKEYRQFILTSHRSELVVGADSDSCFFLKADAGSGRLIGDGVIEEKDIRENLLKFLEGGRNLFEIKLKKYGYEK